MQSHAASRVPNSLSSAGQRRSQALTYPDHRDFASLDSGICLIATDAEALSRLRDGSGRSALFILFSI